MRLAVFPSCAARHARASASVAARRHFPKAAAAVAPLHSLTSAGAAAGPAGGTGCVPYPADRNSWEVLPAGGGCAAGPAGGIFEEVPWGACNVRKKDRPPRRSRARSC
jgi:hypothetical protein